jgi:hypothetical protein
LKAKDDALYFPNDIVPKNKLNLVRYDEKKCYVKAVGERRFRLK